MIASQLSAFTSAARSCAHTMLSNASYIGKELPSIGVSDAHRSAIAQVCSALIGTKHDILTELDDLAELGAAPEAEVVQGRVERITRWLGEEPPKLNEVVATLQSASATDRHAGIAYLLLAESAANVFRSYSQVTEAAGKYLKALTALD